LPEVNLPGWVEFLLEYSKVWVPLLVGVAVAVMAVRHARKSRRIKKAWQAEQVGGSGRAEPTEQAARAEPTEQPGRAEPAEQPEQPGRGEASGPSDCSRGPGRPGSAGGGAGPGAGAGCPA